MPQFFYHGRRNHLIGGVVFYQQNARAFPTRFFGLVPGNNTDIAGGGGAGAAHDQFKTLA